MRRFDFQPSEPVLDNPYIGFTSYQRFRYDPIYSDIVVDPRNNACETEERECFPVPPGTLENGYSEGFYPDCRIAYIRLLWKEFEPRRKEYHFEVIDSLLERAASSGQTLQFRLMPHSTCERDDVPEWLKELIVCPKRPKGMRVKESPSDPVYLEYFREAVEVIALRYDTNPVLDTVDISLSGAWGEGDGWETYPIEALERLVDTYTKGFPHTKLIGQICGPRFIERANKTHPTGWRGDGAGEYRHLNEYYPAYLNELSDDLWKRAPIAFESYWWLGEWYRNGWSIDEVIEKTLEWHVSNFNGKSMPIPGEWKPKIDAWLGRMGYHFCFKSLTLDESSVTITVVNRGVAPLYNKLPFVVELNGRAYRFDPTDWLPGEHRLTIAADRELPHSVTAGIYQDDTVIRFENDLPFDGQKYILMKE